MAELEHEKNVEVIPPNVVEARGDVFEAGDDVPLVHQANCVTSASAELAREVFERYPYANVYARRVDRTRDVPGTIAVRGDRSKGERVIYNVFGQLYPGPSVYPNDSPARRLAWFVEGMDRVARDLKQREPLATEVCLPAGIACGAAGGDPVAYRKALLDFARKIPGVTVRLLLKEKDRKRPRALGADDRATGPPTKRMSRG